MIRNLFSSGRAGVGPVAGPVPGSLTGTVLRGLGLTAAAGIVLALAACGRGPEGTADVNVDETAAAGATKATAAVSGAGASGAPSGAISGSSAVPANASGLAGSSGTKPAAKPAPAERHAPLQLTTIAPPVVMKGEIFPLDFTLNALPDAGTFVPPSVDGLEITTGLGEFATLTDAQGEHASLRTHARFMKTGVITLPRAKIDVQGAPVYAGEIKLEVIDKVTVAPGDIRLEWKADRTRVKAGDPVTLRLMLYSRHSVRPVNKPAPRPADGQADALAGGADIDTASGVPGLAKALSAHFDIVDSDIDPMADKTLTQVAGKRYYERTMLVLSLKAARKGKAVVTPGQMPLMVVTAQSGYFAALRGDPQAMARFPTVNVKTAGLTLRVE
ncbi:hypothetical protein GCM10007242_31360 [Pigmentiphaga litoralis]|nr:hypothetical protein GCM10007242_31360 [Pigmentiphaga litoralis]